MTDRLNTRRTILTALLVLIAALFSAASAYSADTFTVTSAAGMDVTMLDQNGAVSFTITNTSPAGGKSIYQIEFTLDPAKYTASAATTAPSGWCVDTVNPAAGKVKFGLIDPSNGKCDKNPNGSQIPPNGGSLTFTIVLTPASAASDTATDTLSDVQVKSPGGFSLQGALPTWTRRSLEAVLAATPASTGVGGTITLTMLVTNRSTATQTSIGSTPAPPAPSSGIVTGTGGPFYGSSSLDGGHDSLTSVITVGSTAEFPSSGTVQIENEKVCYTGKTATTLTGGTRGCVATTAASHSSGAVVYSLDQFSLAAGEGRTIIWTYSADSTGSVYFTARATNGAGSARSMSLSSNTVVIGNFTASIAVAPSSVVSGQSVTVAMTASNNGSSALVNIVPSLTPCAGGATEALTTGPLPSGVSSVAGGASAVFQWTYSITGSAGSVYCFTGSATADGPVTTNGASSNSGAVSSYSASVSPSEIASGTAPQTFTWTVNNGGGCSIEQVEIAIPTQGGPSWVYQSASASSPAGWSATYKAGTPPKIQFKDPSKSILIAPGGSGVFSITFSSTEAVTSDKDVSFPVTVKESKTGGVCNGGLESSVETHVTVTASALTLSHSPAGPVSADGSSSYTLTATLTSGGNPLSGKTLSFATTNGTLDPSTAVTDANGQAAVTLTAPSSTTDTTAAVTATYINTDKADTVSFTGWTGANLQYWGALNPVTVSCGTSYPFTMNVRNTSTSQSMSLTSASYFAFNDSSSGGTSVFQAYLDSPATVNPSTTMSLTFGSPTGAGGGGGVSVPSGFVEGTYQPSQNPTPPPQSGLYLTNGIATSYYRTVTDSVTVSGGCGAVNVNVIEWTETR